MIAEQLSFFEQSRRLADLGMLERLAGAEAVLDAEPTDLAMREALLLLVVAPAAFGEPSEAGR
jgi:hypothetical protein